MKASKLIQKVLIFSTLLSSLIFANIIHVPGDYPTILLAVNNASNGDTIIVGDGTYSEGISTNKKLVIQSENGPENCKILCSFGFNNGVIIKGFQFSGEGKIGLGGSEVCEINNCSFTDYSDEMRRQIGIYSSNNVYITNCSFNNNRIIYRYAYDDMGLVYIHTGASSVFIDSCIFSDNYFSITSGVGPGGCININGHQGEVHISNSSFIYNRFNKGYAGAIYGNQTSMTINNCVFGENHSREGGAIYFDEYGCTINGCYFYNNSSEDGSAITFGGNNPHMVLYNNTFESNQNVAISNHSIDNSIIRKCNFFNNMNGIITVPLKVK